MTLPDLITRLSEAKEGSRELDAAMGATLRIFASSEPPSWVANWAGRFVAHPTRPGFVALEHTDGELGMNWRAEPVTTSVDAILALIEKRKPSWVGPINLHMAGSGQATLEPRDPCGLAIQAFGWTPALALCIALLTALQSLSGEGEP
jgi:hypothetical protein